MNFVLPPSYCPLCHRLAAFREANRVGYPAFFNAPVFSFGAAEAEFLIVGLAPGLKGANQTGRPFTGDYAGLVLYSALKTYGFAQGDYDPQKVAAVSREALGQGDGFELVNCRITNAVRCVPPENKPEPIEIKQCNRFLAAELHSMPNLKIVLSLGLISHKAVLTALGFKQSAFAFTHGAHQEIKIANRTLHFLNSYHCSRYNINTGRLTQTMFNAVIEKARELIA